MSKRHYASYTDGKTKVIVVTKFHNKKIRGIAKCSPEDTFDFEKGKQLAELRCRKKLVAEQYNFYTEKLELIDVLIDKYNRERNKVEKCRMDAMYELSSIGCELQSFENMLNK